MCVCVDRSLFAVCSEVHAICQSALLKPLLTNKPHYPYVTQILGLHAQETALERQEMPCKSSAHHPDLEGVTYIIL